MFAQPTRVVSSRSAENRMALPSIFGKPGRSKARFHFRPLPRDPRQAIGDHRRADRARLGDPARLQQPHRVASGRCAIRDRARRAVRPGRLRSQLHAARWQPDPRAAAHAVRSRSRFDLLHPRCDDPDAALRRDGPAQARHGRRAHVLALGVDVRAAARARARVRRPRWKGRLRRRIRGAARVSAARRRGTVRAGSRIRRGAARARHRRFTLRRPGGLDARNALAPAPGRRRSPNPALRPSA